MAAKRILVYALITIWALGCAPAAGPRGGIAPSKVAEPPARKRMVASLFSDPAGFHQILTNRVVGSVPGLTELQQMVHAGLVYLDDRDVLRPRLAEAMPTVENGNWKLLPDGRMETTWRLKPNVFWHDGTPFTSDDLAFAVQFNADREVGFPILAIVDLVEAVETPDPHTAVIRWSRPFIEADNLFAPSTVMPLPKHVLEQPYLQDRANALNLRFWREEYIGVGAYRAQEWIPGQYVTLAANDLYVEGRPRIDQIEVRFITEINTITANLLAGSVELHIGRGYGVEQLLELRNTAPNVVIQVGGSNLLMGDAIPMFPQFVNTVPPLVTNLEFRRALLMAIDRQEMTDSINYGFAPIAHTWLQPDRREYPPVEGRIVRYEYSPQRAAQMVEAFGYAKGADGLFRDAAGQTLRLELRTTDQRLIQPRSSFAVADYWKRLGLEVEVNNVPNQLIPDREYRTQFPAFELVAGGITQASTSVLNWRGSASPLAETRFVGGNRARYRNPALDSAIDRYVRSIPFDERMQALGDVIHHQTENLTMMTLFYEGAVTMLGSTRVKNVTSSRVMWNAHLWDVG